MLRRDTFVARGEQWIRAQVLLPVDAAGVEFVRFENSDGESVTFYATPTSGDVHSHGRVGGDVTLATGPYPVGEWFCYEMRTIPTADGELEAFVNGRSLGVLEAELGGRLGFPVFGFGVAWRVGAAPVTVYIDDVAADDERIGCN